MTTIQRDTQSVDFAAPQRWQTIDDRGAVGFRAMTLWGLGTVTGAFRRFRGTLSLEPNATTAELTIDATSVTTGIARLDRALRSSAFLDVDRHHQVTIRSRVVQVGAGGILVDGSLTIAGVPQSCRLQLDVRPGDDGAIVLSGVTEIDREAFGLVGNRFGMVVGNVVAWVELELEPAL